MGHLPPPPTLGPWRSPRDNCELCGATIDPTVHYPLDDAIDGAPDLEEKAESMVEAMEDLSQRLEDIAGTLTPDDLRRVAVYADGSPVHPSDCGLAVWYDRLVEAVEEFEEHLGVRRIIRKDTLIAAASGATQAPRSGE
jgi:hypothetical protein